MIHWYGGEVILATIETMQDPCRVRPMLPTDMDAVMAIQLITWPTEPLANEKICRALTDPTWNCWILEENSSDPVTLGFGLQFATRSSSHIAKLCVHPYQRGCGLGGILLRQMIHCAALTNLSSVTLEVNVSNDHAYKLYEKHGFRITDVLSEYYPCGSDAYSMELIINESE